VFHDEDLAAAILDRVLERGRFVHLDGSSGCTRHLNLEEASPAKAERLRISETHNISWAGFLGGERRGSHTITARKSGALLGLKNLRLTAGEYMLEYTYSQ
jgi:hypothetical protein